MKDIYYDLFNKVEALSREFMCRTGIDLELNLVDGAPVGDRLRKIWEQNGQHTFFGLLKTPSANLSCYKEMEDVFKNKDLNEEMFKEDTRFWLHVRDIELTEAGEIDKIDGLTRHNIGYFQLIVATLTEAEKQLGIKSSAESAVPQMPAKPSMASNIVYNSSDISFNESLGTHVSVSLSAELKTFLAEAPLKKAIAMDDLVLFKIDDNTFAIGKGPGQPGIQIKKQPVDNFVACNNQAADRAPDFDRRKLNLTNTLDAIGKLDLTPAAKSSCCLQ